MSEPNLVTSHLTQKILVEETYLSLEIYRLEDQDFWTLEVVDDEGTSTVWDDEFSSDKEALDAALNEIDKVGVNGFRLYSNVLAFPGKK